MMVDKKRKVPNLRFKGFTDPWVQRKAKDLFIPVNERNREDLPVLSVTQDQGVVFRNNLAIDIKYDESTLSSYKVIHPGDFVISLRSFQGGFELSNVLGISSPAYTIFDFAVPAEQDKLYWKTIFKTFKFIESLKTVTFGIRDGKSISFKEFGDLKLNYPSDVDEQRRIGEFFAKLDETIAANQRKLDLLKEQKKGYLQKMFPKNGAKVPELRFAGFADDWEQRKLQEVLRERNNQQPQSMEYPLVSFTVENGVTPKTDRYEREQLVVGDKSSKKYKVTVLNDIVYNPANLKFGAISRNKYGNAVFSPIYITFLVNNDVTTPEFIEMFVTRNDFIKRALKYQQGTVYERQSVSPTDLLAMNVYLPGKSEQEKIGSFFKQLDDTIDLQHQKLAKYQSVKKSLLQQMFI